jgi:D-glycero-alpha-D-manno-heptose-7-phosphate kinase
MIISRTPFRISFFGGGTDYPAWYRVHGGCVLGTTIDKYCFISCRFLPPFFEHASRVVYSRIELVSSVDEIQHPSVRECLRFIGIEKGVEIHHEGDLPARSGMGSSSAFTVGLLNALYALQGRMASKMELTRNAIQVEQERIGESVGSQDQAMAAFGGFRRIEFAPDGTIDCRPVILPAARLSELHDHLMLVYTGVARTASEVAAEQVRVTPNRSVELRAIQQMVQEAVSILGGRADIAEFGHLLHEAWRIKRGLTDRITSTDIDCLYESARSAGALGGKLLGAGGGGFFLLFVRPEDQPRVRERLGHLLHVPFGFTSFGSQIIYYDDVDAFAPARGAMVS